MDFLPDEIICMITGYLVTADTEQDQDKGLWRDQTFNAVKLKHSRSIDALWIFSTVCSRFRRIALMHAVWSDLNWHLLLGSDRTRLYRRNVSEMFRLFAKEKARLRIRRIHLDLKAKSCIIDGDSLLSLLESIVEPERVEQIVISCEWLSLGDPKIINCISWLFPNCKRLFLQGGQSIHSGVFFGLNDNAVRCLARRMHKLTHLYLEGFGGGSYSWNAFADLLQSNPDIQQLAISNVVGGVDLDKIATHCKDLHSLSIQFYASNSGDECSPKLHGGLSEFHQLQYLAFFDSNETTAMSSSVITRIINTLPKDKIVPKPSHLQHTSNIRLVL